MIEEIWGQNLRPGGRLDDSIQQFLEVAFAVGNGPGAHRWSVHHVLEQRAGQQMVAPFAVDLQVTLGLADFPEAELGEKMTAGPVVGDAGGVDAMEAKALESVREKCANG